jgi:Histidine kinase-, DNA gyrase B-, and HSP90-like ATPase
VLSRDTVDYAAGLKKDVAEIKFLIHDLRVESFFNEVIHYHVTVNTDLEIYSVDQAQILHGTDLEELKGKAREVRRSFQEYEGAVKSFSPDKTVLLAGKRYLDAIWAMCELILDPLWGRIDQILSFLPPESHSARSRSHYRNCLRWICGVYYRLEHFRAEQDGQDVYEQFDVAEDLQDFTRNVVYGYVVEKSSARVELRLDLQGPAVLGGNRHRFRRMYFNLIMNAVDAMSGRKVGVIHIGSRVEGDRVVFQVSDNGAGMPPEKIAQLLADRETLDGELHSLGFVFVRQTVADFGGSLEISSEPGAGTTVTVRVPYLPDAVPAPRQPNRCEKYGLPQEDDRARIGLRPREADSGPTPSAGGKAGWGEAILEDYRSSDATHPGSVFAIAVTEDDQVDYFTHRPYERLWSMTHEDLSPRFFEATVRGRLEDDEEKRPVLILKAPQNLREYFDFKDVKEAERSASTYNRMVHDEYIRIARKLIASGMDGGIGVLLTDIPKLFPGCAALLEREPVELQVLAAQKLSAE